jgi:hypothetical protein
MSIKLKIYISLIPELNNSHDECRRSKMIWWWIFYPLPETPCLALNGSLILAFCFKGDLERRVYFFFASMKYE